jgi:ATP-binding cassette, subfamily B, bacterial MsbA
LPRPKAYNKESMKPKFPPFIRRIIKATRFWQDNYLILREIKHFSHIAILAIVFASFAAIFEGSGIGFLLGFLQNLVNTGAQPFHTGWEWFDVSILGIHTSELSRLYRISALILLSTWIRAGFNYLTAMYMDLARLRLVDRLYKRIFEQLQALSLSFFGTVKSGELVNTLTAEVGQLQQAIGAMSFLITKSMMLVIYVLAALQISWPLSLTSMVLFGTLAVCLTKLNAQVREASFPVSASRGRFTGIAVEFINSIRTVQAFATQDFERRRFYQASDDIVYTGVAASRRMAIVRPIAEGLASSVLIGMIIFGMTVFVANGTLQVASLLTFLFLLFRLVPALQEINGCLASLSSFQGSVQTIQQLLETDDKPYLQNGHRQFTGLQRAIEFVAVEFGYDPSSAVLQDITLTIEKGTTVALVGSSGAGKTTLADLIPRFYDPTQGEVRLDGVNLQAFEISSVRRKMAVVSQETFIFNASVWDNIAYGSEGATADEIKHAAGLANALEFIQEMPEGFDTILGDRGVRLSGGQRQRIAIARALLRNPEILILDEATSALDSVSERLIQESLEKLAVGRTVVAIAHRLSTIVRANKVVVMDHGKIVEQGTYQELLAQRGRLWNYHQMQNQGSEPQSALDSSKLA